ncbi:MAG: peptidoglycan-binding protein, partial [Pseudomonadota bacterium]
MALTRRSGARFEANIWPGFVDALTALLLILMFVLSIFMIVQFSLREAVTGKDREIDSLTGQLAALGDALSLERDRSATLEDALGTTRASLSDAQSESDRLTQALSAVTARLTATEGQLTDLQAEQEAALARLASLQASEAAAQAQITSLEESLAATTD